MTLLPVRGRSLVTFCAPPGGPPATLKPKAVLEVPRNDEAFVVGAAVVLARFKLFSLWLFTGGLFVSLIMQSSDVSSRAVYA